MTPGEKIAAAWERSPVSGVAPEVQAKLAKMIDDVITAEREACAKVAEQKAIDYLSPQYATGQPLSSHAERFACKQIAEAIRARR